MARSMLKFPDFGVLVIRAGFGIIFIMHGWPKLMGGPEQWSQLGQAMSNWGITFYPTAWGLAAALAEFAGGVLLTLGLFTRPVLAVMSFNMLVAASFHYFNQDPLPVLLHPAKALVAFAGLLITGPGRFSVDGMLRRAWEGGRTREDLRLTEEARSRERSRPREEDRPREGGRPRPRP